MDEKEKKDNVVEKASEEKKPEKAVEEKKPEKASEEKKPEKASEEKKPEKATEEKKPEKASEEKKPEKAAQPAQNQKDSGKSRDRGRKQFVPRDREASEFFEKIISIKRVTKVTKGGKKLSFSALVVVGDRMGQVGYSLGKGGEVATAIRKALVRAKKSMVKVPMKGTTITHEIIGECCGADVLLKPAAEGTGVIASGPVRAVCDGAGIHNILTKCHRSNNPTNVVKATLDGFSRLKTKKQLPKEGDVNATA